MTPADIDREAPVVVRLDRTIAAPMERVWSLHSDVARWPEWQKDISSARIDGAFATGESFTWETDGLDEPVTSTIYAVDPGRSTLWGGPAAGIAGVHRWTFVPVGSGTLVVTEESWAGDPVAGDPGGAKAMLEKSLTRWLDYLAAAS